jgi:hypothetical protein
MKGHYIAKEKWKDKHFLGMIIKKIVPFSYVLMGLDGNFLFTVQSLVG